MFRTMLGVVGVTILAAAAVAQEPAATPAPAPAPSATPPPATAPLGAGVNDVKIICDGKVKISGQAGFVFTPDGGESKEVKVTLQKGMKEHEVCRDIAKELSVMLGAGYKVEAYDDDKVKVEGKDGAKFRITQGSNSATGVTLEIK